MKLTERVNDFIKGAVNTVLDASVERQQLINALNSIFKEMYITELVERSVKVSTCKGMEQFKHEMSASTLRSGLLFEVQNDASLRKVELQDIAFIILGFPPIIRQLKLLGFDTLVINGKNTERLFYRIAEGLFNIIAEGIEEDPKKALAALPNDVQIIDNGSVVLPIGKHQFLVADKDAFVLLNFTRKSDGQKFVMPIVAGTITLEVGVARITVEISGRPNAKTLVVPREYYMEMACNATYEIKVEDRNGRKVVTTVTPFEFEEPNEN